MKLHEIQQQLKAPKNQFNKFGGYKYRNCEDILEALKPFLGDSLVTLSDKIVQIGDRFYVEATATYYGSDGQIVSTTAQARESLDKKGMDSAQITGAASSYARKYALNGLFLIDDTKDADSDEQPQERMKPYTVVRKTDNHEADERPHTGRKDIGEDPKATIRRLMTQLGHPATPAKIKQVTNLPFTDDNYQKIIDALDNQVTFMKQQ